VRKIINNAKEQETNTSGTDIPDSELMPDYIKFNEDKKKKAPTQEIKPGATSGD